MFSVRRWILSIAAAAVLLPAVSLPICPGASYAASRNQPRRPTDEEREFASFVDGFLAGVQKERSIPGVVFAAVRNGEVLYLKGYGVTDKSDGAPVDPERTVFRVGALSQPVTAAAIMQLAERGRISLDENVSTYLRRWKIPEMFDNPITVRHLLTHTAGLDFKELETAAPTSSDERGYAGVLQKKFPARYSEPGIFYCESGMGYALLGSILERYSRLNFDAAVKRHVFQPLGMSSSFFTPGAEDLRNMASGYDASGSKVPYEYRYDLPAVGMNTTASDMSRFMIASLAGGVIGRNRMLGEMYSGSMLRRHFSPHQMINGAGLGYLERPVRGIRTLQRRGGISGFSAFLMLIPEHKFGLFLAANVSGIDFSSELSEAVVKRFLPAQAQEPRAGEGQMTIYSDVRGFYRTNRIARNTAEKVSRMFADQIEAAIDGETVVLTHTRGGVPPSRWFPVAGQDDLFLRTEDDGSNEEYIFFQRGETGAVTALVAGSVERTFDKLKTYESFYWQMAMITGFILIMTLSFAGLLTGMAINRGKFPWESGYRSDTELWGISSLFCAVQLTFAAGLTLAVMLKGDEFTVFVPYQVKALFVIPLFGGVLLAWLWFRLLSKIFSPDYHWLEKILIMSAAFAETGYMFFIADWRLLGFMF
ncbi:MAG: beta-lactamase family protein [Synergistaceae bacterium]|nr:beta-lactamase family protein [Synergistaceae bacterium]